MEGYRHFLVHERGLTSGTAHEYVDAVRPFITTRLHEEQIDVAGIVTADVFALVTAVCPGKARGPAQLTATALRSVLGWWHLGGLTGAPLAGVVPAVASWRLARLVEPLADVGIERLDLQQLRYVVAAGSLGSFSGAARRVGVSQPSLSQAIATLEAER